MFFPGFEPARVEELLVLQIIVDLRPTDPDSLPDTPLPEPGPAMETVYEEPGSSLDDLPDEETRESYHPVSRP